MKNKIKKGNLIQRKLREKKIPNTSGQTLNIAIKFKMSTTIFVYKKKINFNGFLNTCEEENQRILSNLIYLF